jgi:hypothetical protein
MQRNIIVQELLYLQRTATSALAELYSVVCMVGIGETGEIVLRRFRRCFSSTTPVPGGNMRFGPFLGIAILLLILWLGGFLMFHIAGGLIHLLLLFAVISLIIHFVTSAKTA